MTRLASIAALTIWAAICTGGADAAILIYAFDTDTSPSAGSPDTSADPNLDATVFADGDGTTAYSKTVGNPTPSVEKAYSEITLASGNYLASTGYYEFSLAAKPGYELNLTQLSFDYDKNR